jgi:hypothetical protein
MRSNNKVSNSNKPPKLRIFVTESQMKRVLNRLVEEKEQNEASKQLVSKFYPKK